MKPPGFGMSITFEDECKTLPWMIWDHWDTNLEDVDDDQHATGAELHVEMESKVIAFVDIDGQWQTFTPEGFHYKTGRLDAKYGLDIITLKKIAELNIPTKQWRAWYDKMCLVQDEDSTVC